LHQVVSEKEISYVRKRKFGTMLPRRCRERPMVNDEEMRQLHARLDAMETSHRRAPEAGDISEDKSKDVEAEEVAGE